MLYIQHCSVEHCVLCMHWSCGMLYVVRASLYPSSVLCV